ncbi:DUF418 domain-containing protein [Streptomyces sp. NPDC093085]|uniref:DUF418 domain-containing protein n=1 Tax=Streptomyces sp. NPDC093085 TaxID=3155068 RepID=UPI0034319D3F
MPDTPIPAGTAPETPASAAPSPSPSPSPSPAPSSGRLPLLDVARGAALLGTLATNVWIFTAPGSEWGVLGTGTAGEAAGGVGGAVESAMRLLANGKFLSLLTLLFGAGLAIQYAAAARRGQPWPGRYRWRALFLFAEGTVHFLLVFAWDVLMGYAVTALLVAWLLTRSGTARRRVMWWAAGAHLTLMGLLTAVLVISPDPGPGDGTPREVADLYAHGGYFDQVAFRIEHALAFRIEPVLSFALLVFLFLLGVRLFRAGAFGDDATGRRIRGRLLLWGLGLGLPLSVVAAWAGPDWFLLDRYVVGPLTALGYLGLLGALMDRVRRPGPVLNGLTSVGRTALSAYVLQNLLCSLAAYGFALGLATRVPPSWHPWWVIALWAAVCTLLMAGSTLWLRHFTAGPLESLQRWALRRG